MTAPAAAVNASPTPKVDFNGDGFADLPIGVHGEDIAGMADVGRVVVLHGSRTGLTDAQGWHQNTPGVPGGNEADDRYGERMSDRDLDNDGYSDLAIAAPGENNSAGAVTVLFGSPSGLRATGAVLLREGVNLPGVAVARDDLGREMTIGNVDTAVYGRELIIGAADTVHVVRSVRSGATSTVITSGTHGLPENEGDPGWGAVGCALTAGAFDGVAGEELVLGQKEGDVPQCQGWLFRGAPGGPSSPESVGHMGKPIIGRDVAAGRGLIADTRQMSGLGVVHIIRSEATREGSLDPGATVSIHQDTSGVPGAGEAGDLFGRGLALSDFNRDGVTDIVAGVHREDIGDVGNTGAVTIVHRRRGGTPTLTGNWLFHQNKRGVPDANEPNDRLGMGVHADDFDGDGIADIVALAEGERLDGKTSGPWISYGPGVLTVRYTRGGGSYQLLHQGLRSVPGSNQMHDHFGAELRLQ